MRNEWLLETTFEQIFESSSGTHMPHVSICMGLYVQTSYVK